MGRGDWRVTVHGVTKSQTWLSDWTHIHTSHTEATTPAPHLLQDKKEDSQRGSADVSYTVDSL